jgi:tRNA-dihydrouridine synthase B
MTNVTREQAGLLIGKNNIPGFPKKIGGVTVNNPIWLAPLAGITFYSIRDFYKRLGAGLVHTEMVSALGLCHKGRKTKELVYGSDSERPAVLQLFGSAADDMARGAEIALAIRHFDAIEVNMACPMPKVTKKGSGAKLMQDQETAAAIVGILGKTGLPVWAKTRVFQEGTYETCHFCEKLFNAGAKMVFIHGRTPSQRYEGTASRSEIGEAAKLFPNMIGGSGDCYLPADFKEYLDMGCAAVLAARGIMRDVFVIPKTLKLLGADVKSEFVTPNTELQVGLLLELGRSIYNKEGEAMALMISRRILAALFKGQHGAARLRQHGALARTWDDMEAMLEHWQETASDN